MVTEAKLKEAKNKLKIEILRTKMAIGRDWTSGVGIGFDANTNMVLRVNLIDEADAHRLPQFVDKIPVTFQVVENIQAYKK